MDYEEENERDEDVRQEVQDELKKLRERRKEPQSESQLVEA